MARKKKQTEDSVPEAIRIVREQTAIAEAAKKKVEEALSAEGGKVFFDLLAPVFAASENIKSISWTQGTPSWNDGDPCSFSAHLSDLIEEVNRDEEEDEDGERLPWAFDLPYDERDWSKAKLKKKYPVKDVDGVLAIHLASELLNEIPEEFYKKVFGGGKRVTIRRNGKIEVDEWGCY
jgi:hypothetical protein